ncbi:tRNA (adenosine(37)-N6)-threonylcarbamoyltransferase complex dimerization subunit type 1 TsaB [Blastococcus sp. Marseille-P5729]|uniref:tRNA (adenosine(37)-N6)-threonylcarbamoyltransferase complex dimerization subunit type 1 TsaB n=1 Tax=Blastococcus sp. Marseille-P5729 TaxID=2086582 RepID=UPI0018FE55DF|nr:tRNA (adenosine(37)-N6)-threonylcarbamoyltransferase complex dimerization subunit type 1 TsaB [Blastococcus sp. Marseille-P5729]
MRLLAIDTATPRIMTGVVELADGTPTQRSVSSETGATAHAEILAPSIERVVREAELAMGDLEGIVAGLGPGPFTGLRVGIVTAAALGDALEIPAWGVCSLDALAPREGRTLVVTDARRREVYFAVYEGIQRVVGPEVAAAADALAAAGEVDAVIHAGAEKYLDELAAAAPVREVLPTPVSLVAAAVRTGAIDVQPTPLQPIYIRRPDAAEPKARPRLHVTGPS